MDDTTTELVDAGLALAAGRRQTNYLERQATMPRYVFLFCLLCAAPAAAQQTLVEMPGGYLRTHINEVSIDPKYSFEDPVKLRMGAFWPTGWLALVGADRLTGDERRPSRDERGFFGIRHNDDYPKDFPAEEFVVFVQDPGTSGDAGMRPRLRVTTDYVEVHGQRLGTGGSPGAWPGCMASGVPGDPYRWQFCQQGTDGNVVSYQVYKGVACARWSAYHGVIPKHTAQPPCNE